MNATANRANMDIILPDLCIGSIALKGQKILARGKRASATPGHRSTLIPPFSPRMGEDARRADEGCVWGPFRKVVGSCFLHFHLSSSFFCVTANQFETLLQLPIVRRAATHFNVIAVSRRNHTAIATFP